VGEGHILDGSTVALWRLDENNADQRGESVTEATFGSNFSIISGDGKPGITDFTPVAGAFCRKFLPSPDSAAKGLAFGRVGSVGSATIWTGTWTINCFLRPDSLPAGATLYPVFGYWGTVGSAANTANGLGMLSFDTNGKLVMTWESGAGVLRTVTQAAGSGMVAGTWYAIQVTKDVPTKTVKFYINGVLQDTIVYTNDPDTGTASAWAMGRNGTTPTQYGDFSLRSIKMSTIVRDAAYALAAHALMSTTGLHVADGSSSVHYLLTDTPLAIDSGTRKLHLVSEGAAAANATEATGLGGLIDDGGRGRMTYDAWISTHFHADIRSMLLGDSTVEMWVLATMRTSAGGQFGLFCHGDPGVETQVANYIAAFVNSAGAITYDAEHGAGVNTNSSLVSAAGVFKFGILQHVAIRKTAQGGAEPAVRIEIFVNGVEVAQGNIHTPDGSNDAEVSYFQIGAGNSGGKSVNGIFDDVRLSNVARSDAEILESYERGADLFVADTSAPTITNFVPADYIIRRWTVIEFDVLDETALAFTGLVDVNNDDVIYDGFEFGEHFQSVINERTVISGGYHFRIRRDDGWRTSPKIRPAVLDTAGNLGELDP
jgi:hypothetical protein